MLAQITALVERAQNSKSPRQRLADKAASVLVVVAIGAGVVTFAAWTLSGAAPAVRSSSSSLTPGAG